VIDRHPKLQKSCNPAGMRQIFEECDYSRKRGGQCTRAG